MSSGGLEDYGKPPGGTLKPPGGGSLGLGLFSVALLTFKYPYFEFRVILLIGENGQTYIFSLERISWMLRLLFILSRVCSSILPLFSSRFTMTMVN